MPAPSPLPLTTFPLQAHANRVVNQRLLDVLAAHQDVLLRPLTGYFKDINAILGHSYVADCFWVADIRFNHQTHHRGQISLALEGFGVEHNYSNLIDID